MICQTDIKELWNLKDESKAILVVKHDYKTKAKQKYLGNKNENYPRKIGQVSFYGIVVILNIEFSPQNLLRNRLENIYIDSHG